MVTFDSEGTGDDSKATPPKEAGPSVDPKDPKGKHRST